MGETVERFRPSLNRSVIVEGGEAKQISDAGLVLVREALERTGLLAQGWGDLADGEGQAGDAVRRVATSSRRGLTPRHEVLPSQSTLSRLLGTLAAPTNRAMLHEAAVRLAGQRLRAANNGYRKHRLTLNIDGAAMPVAGYQAGSAYNGYLGGRVFYPLIASVAEIGDLIDARLREGKAHRGAGVDPGRGGQGEVPSLPSRPGPFRHRLHRQHDAIGPGGARHSLRGLTPGQSGLGSAPPGESSPAQRLRLEAAG